MEKTLKKIIKILDTDPDIKAYAIIGGLAVGGWVTPRATKDIDILVELPKTDRTAIERGILRNLIKSGFESVLEKGAPEDNIKFCIKAVSKEGVPVDIIFVSRKWEGEVVEDAFKIELMKGISLPIVKP